MMSDNSISTDSKNTVEESAREAMEKRATEEYTYFGYSSDWAVSHDDVAGTAAVKVTAERRRNIDKRGYLDSFLDTIDTGGLQRLVRRMFETTGNIVDSVLTEEGGCRVAPKEDETIAITPHDLLTRVRQLGVEVQGGAQVRDYLTRHPGITEAVLQAAHHASKQFGDRAGLSLQVYNDPHINDEHLVIYVRQEHYEEGIMEEIKNVWPSYASLLSDTTGWLHLTTDFQPLECGSHEF